MSFENYETSKNSQVPVNVALGQMKYLKALSMYCKAVNGML